MSGRQEENAKTAIQVISWFKRGAHSSFPTIANVSALDHKVSNVQRNL